MSDFSGRIKNEPHGVVTMDRALATDLQEMMAYRETYADPNTALVVDGMLTDKPRQAMHVSDGISGAHLHDFLDDYLAAHPDNKRELGPKFDFASRTDADAVKKMQASIGYRNTDALGLKREEVRAIKGLGDEEMKTARGILDGSINVERVDPAIMEKLSQEFPVKLGQKTEHSSVLKALDKIQGKISKGPDARAAALDDIHAGHVIDGHYGAKTQESLREFVEINGHQFAKRYKNAAPGMGSTANIALPEKEPAILASNMHAPTGVQLSKAGLGLRAEAARMRADSTPVVAASAPITPGEAGHSPSPQQMDAARAKLAQALKAQQANAITLPAAPAQTPDMVKVAPGIEFHPISGPPVKQASIKPLTP